jgi:hypothetical protein
MAIAPQGHDSAYQYLARDISSTASQTELMPRRRWHTITEHGGDVVRTSGGMLFLAGDRPEVFELGSGLIDPEDEGCGEGDSRQEGVGEAHRS